MITESQTNTTKDDLALMHEPTHCRNLSNTSYDTNMVNLRNIRSHNKRGPTDRNRANKINSNRFSCGDFSRVLNRTDQVIGPQTALMFEQGNNKFSLFVKIAVEHKDFSVYFWQC